MYIENLLPGKLDPDLWLMYVEFPCMFSPCPSGFPQGTQKHDNRWIEYDKLPLGMNECVDVCLRGPLR